MSLESTVQVRRGGSYLTIAATSVERYLAKGYDVVDSDDNVIKQSIPNDINVLRKAFEDHVAEIEALKAELASIKAEKAKTASVKQEVSVKEFASSAEESEIVATNRKRSKKN